MEINQVKRSFPLVLALMLVAGAGLSSCMSETSAQRRAQAERSEAAAQRRPAAKAQEGVRQDIKTDTLSDANIFALLLVANSSDLQGAQLGKRRARYPQVKALSSLMVEEHSSLLEQGDRLAGELNIVPVMTAESEQLVREHNRMIEELSAKSGFSFDEAYIGYEINMHQQVLQKVEQAGPSARHPRLKELLDRTKPALAAHLHAAQEIERELKGKAGMGLSQRVR